MTELMVYAMILVLLVLRLSSGDNPKLTVKCGSNSESNSIGINIGQNLVIKNCIINAESDNP